MEGRSLTIHVTQITCPTIHLPDERKNEMSERICPDCEGKGKVVHWTGSSVTCQGCGGHGRMKRCSGCGYEMVYSPISGLECEGVARGYHCYAYWPESSRPNKK